MSYAERVVLESPAFPNLDEGKGFWDRGKWPAHWICAEGIDRPPLVVAFRLRISVPDELMVRVHLSADQRYRLFLNGERVGHGPERGDANYWFYETYDLALDVGENTLVALVWALPEGGAPDGATARPANEYRMPVAQISVTPGCFVLAPDEADDSELFATGKANWEVKTVSGISFLSHGCAWGTGGKTEVDGASYPWGIEAGEGDGWQKAAISHLADDARSRNDRIPKQALRPAMLPAMLDDPTELGLVRLVAEVADGNTADVPVLAADNLPDEQEIWQALLSESEALTIPAHTRRRVLIDLEDYYCAWPELIAKGGAGSTVRISWQEALIESKSPWSKGNRDQIEGKFFCQMWNNQTGVADVFRPSGGEEERSFTTLWWQCGRYVELYIETANEPLELISLTWRETRYPLYNESEFESSDPKLESLIPMMTRAMQMCAHETYFDCPYYEQLMYAGDTRLEVLTTYIMTGDDALPRKAALMFDISRLTTGLTSGLTQSRYPGHILQIIPPFSLWWVGMVYDRALWRGDREFVKERMTGVRAVLDAWTARRDPETGLILAPNGWNYIDWVPGWKDGIAPGNDAGTPGGIHNWHVVYTLQKAAELEGWLGEVEREAHYERLAREIAKEADIAFWDEQRGLWADDWEKTSFSEHAQCLALLSLNAPTERVARVAVSLLGDPNLHRTTIYYSHYLFETYFLLGRPQEFFQRLDLWHGLVNMGFKTTVESPEPSRSDCHAWGAHPLFHYHASVLGVRPTEFGFDGISVMPQLGHLTSASGRIPHPKGEIVVSVERTEAGLTGTVELPEGVKAFQLAEGLRLV